MATGSSPRRRAPSPPQIVVLSFVMAILTGAVLLSLPVATKSGESIGFLNAFFTATSATCVTGLVVVDTGTAFSLFGQIVILLLIQVGGLGIMTMTAFLYLLVGRRIGLRGRILIQESLGQDNLSGIVRLVRSIFLFTMLAEAAGAVLLTLRFSVDMPAGQAAYFGIFHAVSAFCNAGFDLLGSVFGEYSSVIPYASDPTVMLTISGLISVGGLGFLVLRNLRDRRREGRLLLHTRVVLRTTALLLAAGTVAFFVLEYANPDTLGRLPLHGKILSSWFHSVTPRTAGFNSLPVNLMGEAALFLTIMLMFVGASPGGTGGGIKTTTAWVIYRSVVATVRGEQEIDAEGRSVPRDLVNRALAIGAISLALVLTVTSILLVSERARLMECLFETMSAFGTVGLTMGLTPKLTALGRLIIALTMLAGRVGPLTMAVSLATHKDQTAVHFPEERVLVG